MGSWRLIFLINVPLAVTAAAVALRHVPETRDPSAVRGIDVAGAVLAFVGLAGVTWALIEAGSAARPLACSWPALSASRRSPASLPRNGVSAIRCCRSRSSDAAVHGR